MQSVQSNLAKAASKPWASETLSNTVFVPPRVFTPNRISDQLGGFCGVHERQLTNTPRSGNIGYNSPHLTQSMRPKKRQ